MSDLHEHAPEAPEPADQPGAAGAPAPAPAPAASEADAPAELGVRPDPRLRPPDPAGTQPQWDDEDLLPKHRGNPAPGSLWGPPAPAGDPEDLGTVVHGPGAQAGPGAGAAGDGAATVAATAAGGAADADADGDGSRFGPHFQFALGALMAVAAAAVVLFVAVLAGRGDHGSTVVALGPSWSAWHPDSGSDGAAQIAQHVGRQYRLPDGKQLVAVTGGPMEIAGLPVTVAIRETAAQGGDIKLIDGSGVLFRLCGLGPKCAIAEGKPSAERLMLLRREALELALYSFRYLGVSTATVFMPPPKGKDPTQALFFRRGDADLQAPMSQPLDATLVARTPSVSGVKKSPDAALVNDITLTKWFTVSFTQANQDARAFMVLDPLK